MWFFFAQAAPAAQTAAAKTAEVAQKTSAMLTGSEVALWTMGAITAMLSAYKLFEWLLSVAGMSKSPQDKVLDALGSDLAKVREVHSILTDKVFAKEQEGRFDDIAGIKQEIDRVFAWMKTPPEVETPPFWCRSGALAAELRRIGTVLDELTRNEGEREKQTELIIKLLHALAARRNGDG